MDSKFMIISRDCNGYKYYKQNIIPLQLEIA